MSMNTTTMNVTPRTVRKLSLVRLCVVCLALGVPLYFVFGVVAEQKNAIQLAPFTPWFAAYVDVTSVPAYSFEKQSVTTVSNDVVLAFIVADTEYPCEPTWGTHFTMDAAAEQLDLDRRIARLQQQGGKIALSFGGALNKELGLACTDAEMLGKAYHSVIDRYNVSTIDLDLENESLTDSAAQERRATVIATLQHQYKAQGKNLVVWLTLPGATSGLAKEGTDAVSAMLAAGVDIAGVNVMVMDFGTSKDGQQTMSEASEQSLREVHRQLGILYKKSGTSVSDVSLWAKLGATPMIGQNDVVDEVFTLDDAVALNQFAHEQGLGRMSMWSANRDIPCGENYADRKVVSDVCSGVTTPPYTFGATLRTGFIGDLMQQATMITTSDPHDLEADDSKTSPYQIWNENGIYTKGTKVVWRKHVYEAKWWSKNDTPDNPVLQAWETPWQLIGPVLSTDKPMEQVVLPPGMFPKWQGQSVYDAGDRVFFEGVAFRAKWWNQGESPAAAAANPESSPWIPLTQEQVQELLKNRRSGY